MELKLNRSCVLGFHVAGSTGNSGAGSLASLPLVSAMLISQAVFPARRNLTDECCVWMPTFPCTNYVHKDSRAELGFKKKIEKQGRAGGEVRCSAPNFPVVAVTPGAYCSLLSLQRPRGRTVSPFCGWGNWEGQSCQNLPLFTELASSKGSSGTWAFLGWSFCVPASYPNTLINTLSSSPQLSLRARIQLQTRHLQNYLPPFFFHRLAYAK